MPMNLTDLLNAKSLNKYYAGVKGTTLVEAMFPAVFSNTFDIYFKHALNKKIMTKIILYKICIMPMSFHLLSMPFVK